MNPFTVCIFGIAAAVIISSLRKLTPETSAVAAAVAGVIIFIYVAEGLISFVDFIKTAAEENGLSAYFSLMLKALAITLACKMSAEICRDCGENALASRVELAGKVGIVLLSLPIIKQLLDIAKDMV